MDKEQLNKLSELIDFLQKDFPDTPSHEETRGAYTEFGRLLQSGLYLALGLLERGVPYSGEGSEAEPVQTAWETFNEHRENLLELVNVIYKVKEQGGRIYYNVEVMFWPKSGTGTATFEQSKASFSSSTEGAEIRYLFGDHDPSNTHILYSNTLSAAVLDLFEGLPPDRLKRCLECRKFFIQATGRERKFCCDYCKVKKHLKDKKG